MPEHEAPGRAFYDHESDEPRLAGRRRRPVADWGVGDDVFDRMPSRRFARADHVSGEPRARSQDHHRPADGRDHARPSFERGGTLAGDGDGRDHARHRFERGGTLAGDGDDRGLAASDKPAAAAPEGRRTVVISGHPDRLPAPRSRRRPKTAVERVGARPDRILAYAVAMGFLLIAIAILTTGQ